MGLGFQLRKIIGTLMLLISKRPREFSLEFLIQLSVCSVNWEKLNVLALSR